MCRTSFLQGCRIGSLAWLCVAFCTSIEFAHAQPALVAEGSQPLRYAGIAEEMFLFALPGKRYLRVGSYDEGTSSFQRFGIMLAVTKQNGDTVRYMRVQTHPPGTVLTGVSSAVMEPDRLITMLSAFSPNPRVSNRDSLMMLRIDTMGVVRWRRSYPFLNGVNLGLGNLLRTGDGYLFCTNPDAFGGANSLYYPTPVVTKVDFAGNVVWERSMGTRGYARIGSVKDLVACPDGSYLAFGNTDDGSPYTPGTSTRSRLDYYAVRFTSAGDTLRTYRFGDPGQDEQGERIRLTPGGGAAITGTRARYSAFPPPTYDGQVYQLDSLFRPQWQRTNAWPALQVVDWRYAILQPLASGNVVCGGIHFTPPRPGYPGLNALAALAAYTPAGATAWTWQHTYPGSDTGLSTMVSHADGSAYVTGGVGSGAVPGGYNDRFAAYSAYLTNVGVPYVPDLCARPPAAYFVAQATSPTQAQVLESSAPGPRYGVLVAWRWAWGDGSTSTGRAPGPHAYASPPPPGTAVTLTVTNNLGCTSSRTEYPFGPLSAAQASRALAGRLALFPNPTSGAVAVQLGGLAPQGPAALALLNPLGQVLRRATAPVQAGQVAATLDLGGLPAGLYLLRVSTREGTATKRVVKE